MHQIKLDILANGGRIYYSDTDSLATNLSLDQLKEIMPERIGNKLGQLKFEHNVQEAFFISNKTYALKTKDGKEIKKAKGVLADNLSMADFEQKYFNKKTVIAQKFTSETSHGKGFVLIKKVDVTLNWDSFTKRDKIYKDNYWVDTKPLYLDSLTRCITNYIPKNIVKYNTKLLQEIVLK